MRRKMNENLILFPCPVTQNDKIKIFNVTRARVEVSLIQNNFLFSLLTTNYIQVSLCVFVFILRKNQCKREYKMFY